MLFKQKIIPIKLITLVLSIAFLAGCNSIPSAIGKSPDQLREEMRTKQTSSHHSDRSFEYACAKCDGSANEVWTNNAGNQVASYLFSTGRRYDAYCSHDGYSASCEPAFSICYFMAENFEFKNNAVIRAWKTYEKSTRRPYWDEPCLENYDFGILYRND